MGLLDLIFKVDEVYQAEVIKSITFLLLIWGLAGSVGGIIAKILPTFGYYSNTTYLAVLNKFLEVSVLITGIFLDLPLSTLALILSITLFLYSIGVLYYVKYLIPEYYPWWQYGSFSEGSSNFYKSLVLTSNSFINKFSTDGLILVISTTLGTAIVPLYTTIRTLANVATQVTTLLINPLKPELIRYHSTKQFGKIIEVVKTNWFITGLILNIPFVISVFIIDDLYLFWTKGKLEFNLGLYLLLSLSVLILNYGQTYTAYLNGINHLKALFILTISRGTLIFLGTVILLPAFGIITIGWVFVFTELLISSILPAYFFGKVVKPFGVSMQKKVSTMAISSILVVALFFLLSYKSYINLFIGGIFTVILILSISFSQWKLLSKEVTSRILRFAPPVIKRLS